MNTGTVFSAKAENYHRYRWDYAPEAIEATISLAHLTGSSVIADFGAGTGILTKHFVNRVNHVYAIEPSDEMRHYAEQQLGHHSSVSVIKGTAEATHLPDQSVDLIMAAHAIHWFDPTPTYQEIQRIMRKDGRLALFRNRHLTVEQNASFTKLMSPEFGVNPAIKPPIPHDEAVLFYFGEGNFQRQTFPFAYQEGWAEFFGSLLSISNTPEPAHPLFPVFEQEARAMFERHSANGLMGVRGETELILGHLVERTSA